MSETVLVTRIEYEKAQAIFAACEDFRVIAAGDDEASLSQAVRDHDCRAVIVGVEPYSGPLYDALAEARGQKDAIIVRFGVGHDSVDKTLARERSIAVANTPGVLNSSVAEHTIWLMGSLARHVGRGHAAMMASQWRPERGVELNGLVLGILGFGAIGRRVARIAHFGFGMRVVAADRFEPAALEQREGRSMEAVQQEFGLERYTTDVTALFRESDVLSILLPATEENRQFVNADRLAHMKPDALLINTARGAVLDEAALYDALAAGRLAGAALDVYQQEPYEPVSSGRDLRTLPNILLTPHIGSNTRQANEAMAQASLKNAVNFLRGNVNSITFVE